jgi:simple sugar transport system permease protein
VRLPFAWRLERRAVSTPAAQAAALSLGLVAAFVTSALLIISAGASLLQSLAAFYQGAFGDWEAIAETLVQATPLIFTGLAVTLAFRSRLWNIGAEGQFFAGTMAAVWVGTTFAGLPSAALFGLIVAGSTLAGAAWGLIPGWLKARYRTNEVVVTVMMNYIIQYILSFLLSGPWRDPNSFFLQTAAIPEAAYFPRLFAGTRLHAGFLLALLAAGLIYVLLWKTVLGYEIRAYGINTWASRYKGINVTLVIVLVMAISGGLAGLAGGSEVAGLHHRLRLDISTGYGFTGILIALLGRLNPFGVILASILFGGLINGSTGMQIATGVPVALVYAVQGLTLIFVLAADTLSRYRLVRTVPAAAPGVSGAQPARAASDVTGPEGLST